MDRASALAALRWWMDAGVDAPVGDATVSWLVDTDPSIQPEPVEGGPRARTGLRQDQPERIEEGGIISATARAAADAAGTLVALGEVARAYAGAGALVFDGAPEAGIVFVTDAPGADDEREGKLFAGQAGRLLDGMLAAIGLDRTSAGLATAALRIGGGTDEIAFLQRLIVLAKPLILVALGGPATLRLTHETRGLNRLRGKWLETSIGSVTIPVLPTFHPAHLLANPQHKALAWADLLVLRSRLDVR